MISKSYVKGTAMISYRLGDLVKDKKWRTPEMLEWLSVNAPDSIAAKYLSKTEAENDYGVLLEIINGEEYKMEIPKKNELIVHLRIGDIFGYYLDDDIDDILCCKENLKFLDGVNDVWSLRSYNYYDAVFKNIPTELDRVVIVCGLHTINSSDVNSHSYEYLYKISEYIRKKGYEVEIRYDNNADTDFVYMSNAKYFVMGTGGFSALVSEMVKKNRGNCIRFKL
jgi:hypothetical protein